LLLLACHSESVFETILMLAERDRIVADTKIRKICDEMTRTVGALKGILDSERKPRSARNRDSRIRE
jgi:hypothetical protein